MKEIICKSLLARYAAILQNTPCVAMLSLFNIPSNDASKMTQRISQCMCSSIHQTRKTFLLLIDFFSSSFQCLLIQRK